MNRAAAFLCVAGFLHAAGMLCGQGSTSTQAVAAPTATIFSNDKEVCEGSAVAAYLYFSGEGPWDAVVSDKDGIYLELTDVTSPYTISLEPVEDNTYTVSYVEDRLGQAGSTYGAVSLTVNPVTPVSIELDRYAYLYSEPQVRLFASPTGGTFTGNGVSANYFYPGIASPEGSPHQVTYTYYNQYGCVSKDVAEIHVLFGESSVVLLSGNDTIDDLCDDGRTYVILGSNNDQLPGTFELVEAGTSQPIEGNILDEDLSDDLAILNPAGLSGVYDIVYSYSLEGLTVSATYRFRVSDLGLIQVPGLPEEVCSGDEPYPLVPDLAGSDPGAIYTFSGPGVTGSQEDGYYFDPGGSDTILGAIEIQMDYTATNGCYVAVVYPVNNRFSPEVSFGFSPVCLPDDGGLVSFTNTTAGKEQVETWEWSFGDPASGPDNSSNLENPTHDYPEPGFLEISLTATTADGCVAVYSMDTSLADQPKADFTWVTDCFIKGEKTRFINTSTSEFAALDTVTWTFTTSGGGGLGVIGSNDPADTLEFQFTVRDRYKVELYVRNESGCEGEAMKEIDLQPTIHLTSAGYKDGFNGTHGFWSPGSVDSAWSWTLGEPDFNGFSPVEGDLAWYTDLPAGGAGYLEDSWVQGPCFDFSDQKNPLIKLDLMKSFTPGYDGAVLQYQIRNTEDWKTIGAVGEGLNWYNVTNLVNQPGGSNAGWGLELFDPDSEWIHASHDLDALAGMPHVKLRFTVSTGGIRDIGNQGFAFDNVFIGDRIRKSVLEHFTNSASASCREADAIVDDFSASNPGSVVDLQYHTDFPGSDPMNQNNPYPASIRTFYYGVGSVPYALLNGGGDPELQYDFDGPDGMPDEEVLKQASLEIPVFDLSLKVEWMENSLDATASVTCLADTFTSNIQLHVAVIETEVTAYTGANMDTLFRNVVLDMLPSSTGTLLGKAWSGWMTETRSFSWEYANYVEDIEELAVVAFIENRSNGQIIQAATSYLTPQVGTGPRRQELASLHLYPNPASDVLYLQLGESPSEKGFIKVMDITGKIMLSSDVRPGEARLTLDLSTLARGLYVVWWEESGVVRARSKLIMGH